MCVATVERWDDSRVPRVRDVTRFTLHHQKKVINHPSSHRAGTMCQTTFNPLPCVHCERGRGVSDCFFFWHSYGLTSVHHEGVSSKGDTKDNLLHDTFSRVTRCSIDKTTTSLKLL